MARGLEPDAAGQDLADGRGDGSGDGSLDGPADGSVDRVESPTGERQPDRPSWAASARRGGRQRRPEGGKASGRRSRAARGTGTDPAADAGAGRGTEVGPRGGADAIDDPESLARTIVLRKLAAQARTRDELGRALAARDVPAEAAAAVLDRMTDVGLVDDARFARDWVSSRQSRRNLSRTVLRRELTRKGVDTEVVEEALAETAVGDEQALAHDLASRKLRTMHGLGREVKMRRLAGVLARRGFSASVVAGVVTSLVDGLEDSD